MENKKSSSKSTNKEESMDPKPVYERDYDRTAQKLSGKTALITGGDSTLMAEALSIRKIILQISGIGVSI